MIFLRYESFKDYLRSYPVTAAVATICIIYFLISKLFGIDILLSAFIVIPHLDPWGFTEPWRYLTSIFTHLDFEHLFHNMFMLIVFAPPLERVMGSKRYVWFYLISGIGGNLLSALISNIDGEGHIAVGASGAIFGVFGAYFFLVIFRKQWLDPASKNTIAIILVISLITSVVFSKIDFWGHLGGFITGFMLYRFFDQIQMMKVQKKRTR